MAKGVLNRAALEGNGITFNREVVESTGLRMILGKQAEILATRLLDFRTFAPQERAKTLKASMDRNILYMSEDVEDPKRRQAIRKLKARAAKACNHAQKIVVPSESRWMDFVKTLFEPMITRARDIEGAGTIGVRDFEKSLRVDSGGDRIWHAADWVRSATAPCDAPKLTRPKPDLFISLPTVKEDRASRGFAREPVLGTFRVDRLQLLENERGVVSSPLKVIGHRKVEAKDCLCFPCVVLEAKHHEVSQAEIVRCYCQAANGAASALALLNELAIDCLVSGIKTEIRPVVIITLNGQRTRVWIAGIKPREVVPGGDSNDRDYDLRERTRVRYHMQCIWKGDVHFEESMMELICIIDSLEKWIIDDFRPWVSGNLGRHYRKMDRKVEYYVAAEGYSPDEEDVGDGCEYSASETSEEYEETDEEQMDPKVGYYVAAGGYSPDEEDASDGREYSASETSEEYEETDEEEMDPKVGYCKGAEDYSPDDEDAGDDSEYSASETSEEFEKTDEEEKKWDEDWMVPDSEESESELDSDSEGYNEYVQDLARADSLMAELSLNDPARSARGVHRFIEVRRELGV